MTNVTLLKRSVLTNALGSMVLILLGAACSNAEEAHLVMIGDQTTLSIRMRLPNELVLRKATYADSKSAKLESAIRERLDANQDNVLGSDELSKAEALLDRLDFDEDECLAPLEIAADLLTSRNSANSSQSVTSVLVRSADDTEDLVSLRRELDNHGRQGEEPVARVDATIDWDGNHDGAIQVRVEANSKARVERFTSSVGSTRFLIFKDDLTVDLWTGKNWTTPLYIDVRPGRRGLFEWLDVDGNSKLSRIELKATESVHVEREVRDQALPFENSVAIQIGADRLRRYPYVSLLPDRARASSPQNRSTTWFEATDQNRDGVLSINEFLAGDKTFIQLDSDRDNLLTPDEANRKH